MKRVGWLDLAEVGGTLGIRFFVVVCTVFGRAPARFFLRFLAFYYVLFNAPARRASRSWLGKALGRERVPFAMVNAHILHFAQVALDRLFLVRRQMQHFDMRNHGLHHVREIIARKRGTLLLGSHLGSFEAMRALADAEQMRVNVLGYFANAGMINAALDRLDPRNTTRVIEIVPGKIDFIFEAQECIERGEHVAVLGDRVGLGGATVEIEFMGAAAEFPTGVYVLAHTLRCPVYLFFCLYSDPNRYDIYRELFAEQVILPHGTRKEALAGYAHQYADRLAHYGRLAPYNWFNFFDFWI